MADPTMRERVRAALIAADPAAAVDAVMALLESARRPTYGEMVEQLKAADVLVFHDLKAHDRLVPYPHRMPPGGVDLWRISEDIKLLAAVCAERTGDEQPPPAEATPDGALSYAIGYAERRAAGGQIAAADVLAGLVELGWTAAPAGHSAACFAGNGCLNLDHGEPIHPDDCIRVGAVVEHVDLGRCKVVALGSQAAVPYPDMAYVDFGAADDGEPDATWVPLADLHITEETGDADPA